MARFDLMTNLFPSRDDTTRYVDHASKAFLDKILSQA
jgi:hypothetical protein